MEAPAPMLMMQTLHPRRRQRVDLYHSSLSLVGAAVFVSSSHLSPHAHCLSKYSLNTIIIPTSSARTCNELHWPHVCFSINTRSVHANYEHCI